MRAELEAHWEIVAEGAQTILRAAGVSEAYNQLKSLARGKEITKETFNQWIENLSVEESVKQKLRALSPLTCIGLAEEIATLAFEEN
jgi:adenylosuccinate lyase